MAKKISTNIRTSDSIKNSNKVLELVIESQIYSELYSIPSTYSIKNVN